MSDETSGAEPSPPGKKKSRFSLGSKKDPGAAQAPKKPNPLMQRNVMAAAATALFAVVGVLLLVSYIQGAEDDAAAERALKPVIVATSPIPKGTMLSDLVDGDTSQITIQELPDDAIAAGAFATMEQLGTYEELQATGDLMVNSDLATGEQLLTSRVSPVATFHRRVAPAEIPPDHHQVTLELPRDRALGGLIRPGDRVSVVASFAFDIGGDELVNTTAMVLASVEVVSVLVDEEVVDRNVSSETADDPFLAPAGAYLITLAVTPDELTKLVYVKENARLFLAGAAETRPTGQTYPQDIQSVMNSPSFNVDEEPSTLAFNEEDLRDSLLPPGDDADGEAPLPPDAPAVTDGDDE